MRWHSSLYKKVTKQSNGLFYPARIGPFFPTREGPFLPDPNRVKNRGRSEKNNFSPRTVLKWLEFYLGNFNDPVMRAKILPYIIDKIMVDDDNLALNLFFSDEKREENVESILAKIKAYEDYEHSIKNKRLDISDEEFVWMTLGDVPDMNKAIDSLKGNNHNKDGSNFFV